MCFFQPAIYPSFTVVKGSYHGTTTRWGAGEFKVFVMRGFSRYKQVTFTRIEKYRLYSLLWCQSSAGHTHCWRPCFRRRCFSRVFDIFSLLFQNRSEPRRIHRVFIMHLVRHNSNNNNLYIDLVSVTRTYNIHTRAQVYNIIYLSIEILVLFTQLSLPVTEMSRQCVSRLEYHIKNK